MKKKISKILGVALALVLAFSLGAGIVPVGQEVQASPDMLEWSKISTPSQMDNVIVPGSDIYDYAVGPDGDTIYAIGAITGADDGIIEGSRIGLTGSFYTPSGEGEVTVKKISANLASFSGKATGEACYLSGYFTAILEVTITAPSFTGTAVVTGEITYGDPTVANDDTWTFSGTLYWGTGGFPPDGDYTFGNDWFCVDEWGVISPGPWGDFVINDGIYTQPRVWKSTDGGVTWDDITATVQDATNLPGPFIDFMYGGVAVAPDDEDWLVVAGEIYHPDYSPGGWGMPAVVASQDGGDKFVYIGDMIDTARGTMMAWIYDVAIAPEVDGIHNVAVAGINDDNDGTVYRFEAGHWLGGGWEDTSFYAGWDDNGTLNTIGVVAVAFSPNFEMDQSILCMGVVTGPPLPYLQSGIWEVGGSWNAEAEFANAVQIKSDGEELWTLPGLRSMGLALPADYDGGESTTRSLYLYVNAHNSVTGLVGGYVFRVDDNALSMRCGPSGAPLLASIAVHGDADTCKAMVGTYIDWDDGPVPFETCQGVAVYMTVELDVCCPKWDKACKNPSGPYMAVVSYTPDGDKAYATTSGALDWMWFDGGWDFEVYWGGLCDESAFSVSLDDGVSWNQIGLIDTDIDYISDVAVCPDCGTVYISTINNMENWGPCCTGDGTANVWQVGECDSIWRSYDDGDTWERVFHGNWTSSKENALLLRQPVDVLEDCCDQDPVSPSGTLYLGIQGTKNLYYTTDCGQCWRKAVAQKVVIQDIAIESEKIVYILDNKGYVSKSTNYGRSPSTGVNTKVGSGHTIAVMPDDMVLVGGEKGGKVAYSDDGGETFSLTDKLPTAAKGEVHVAFAPLCEDIIFAAVSGAGIYRGHLDTGKWDDLNAMPYNYYGIVLGKSDGTLYAATSGIWVDTNGAKTEQGQLIDVIVKPGDVKADAVYSGVARNLDPCETECCGAEDWDYLYAGLGGLVATPTEWFNAEPSALRICGCITADTNSILWAIDFSPYAIADGSLGALWVYEDCLAKVGPELLSPADGADIPADPCECISTDFTLRWERLCLACKYDVQFALDEDFVSTTHMWYDYAPPSGARPSMVVDGSELTCEVTYYWRVRVSEAETTESIKSAWSEVWSFTIGAGPGAAITLLAPGIGATNIAVTNVPFSWSSVVNATSYTFLLSANSDLSTPLVTTALTGTAYTYTGTLDYDTPYYWQVRALKDASVLSTSGIGTFTTVAKVVEVWTCPQCGLTFDSRAALDAHLAAVHAAVTPAYIWVIIAVGALLVIAMLILIVRTRRTV